MKRNMDLIRKTTLAVAEGKRVEPATAETERHLMLAVEASLVQFPENELTWAGHEFYALASNDKAWKEAHRRIDPQGGAPFSIWLATLKDIATQKIMEAGPPRLQWP